MQPVDDVEQTPATRVAPGFIAVLTLAYIGAFIAFVPLLSLLTPMQAEAIAPADKIGLLSLVSLWGAVTASVANLAIGWASDRTGSRFGKRRPWILCGLIGVVCAYYLIARASTPVGLLLGVMAFQLAFNLLFAPLHAIFADMVPDDQKGQVAAFIGIAAPIGAASGVLIAAPVLSDMPARLSVLGVLVAACILPLLFIWKEAPSAPLRPQDRTAATVPAPRPGLDLDFGFVWASRFCFQISVSVISAYMLFYLADHARYESRFPGSTVESGLARLIAFSTLLTLAAGFVGGLASDRFGRRKPFILLSSALIAGGLLIFAFYPEWPGPLLGYALYGLGFGLYTTVDTALVAQILPSRRHTARDLGVMNLTNTLPAVLAPVLAIAALGTSRADWPMLMMTCAGIALLGGLAIKGVRRAR
nr:MFS transporter [uncultured Brevundimonas sp.]